MTTNLPSIEIFLKDYGVLIGSLVASATALFIAIGRNWLETIFFKPKLKVLGIKEFYQTPTLSIWRLVIKNVGNATAKDVQVDVVELSANGVLRENLLPVPLRWTHFDKESRDILQNQVVYLDVFEHISKGSPERLEFTLRFGTRFGVGIRDFSELEEGKSELKLEVFQQNGDSYLIRIKTEWDGEFLFDVKRLSSKKIKQPDKSELPKAVWISPRHKSKGGAAEGKSTLDTEGN